jgi:hypothetical protein
LLWLSAPFLSPSDISGSYYQSFLDLKRKGQKKFSVFPIEKSLHDFFSNFIGARMFFLSVSPARFLFLLPPHHFSNGPPLSSKIIEYILRWIKQINNLRKDMYLFSCEKEGGLLERARWAYFACRTCRLRARVFLCTQHVAPKMHACLGRNLPRPQSLSRGGGRGKREKIICWVREEYPSCIARQ